MSLEFDYSKLRGRITEKYNTIENFTERLGIGRSSMSAKLNNKTEFTTEEIYVSCELLSIPLKDVHQYFFKVLVQKTGQN